MESLVQSLRELSYESSGCLELIDKMAEKSHVSFFFSFFFFNSYIVMSAT